LQAQAADEILQLGDNLPAIVPERRPDQEQPRGRKLAEDGGHGPDQVLVAFDVTTTQARRRVAGASVGAIEEGDHADERGLCRPPLFF